MTDSSFLFVLQDIDSSEAELAQMTMGIYTVQSANPGNGCFAGVVLEGVTVIPNLPSVTMGCVMLFGLIYSPNLSYPKDLKSTFEFYQKIIMELDPTKLSPKVQGLKVKLLK